MQISLSQREANWFQSLFVRDTEGDLIWSHIWTENNTFKFFFENIKSENFYTHILKNFCMKNDVKNNKRNWLLRNGKVKVTNE